VRRVAVAATAAGTDTGRVRAATVARSRVVPASGYAAVGAVWDRGGAVAGQRLELRTRTDGRWTAWQALTSDAEHAPEPGTAEARGARPGTDPYVVGDVDDVQLRASAPVARAPEGLTLVVVDPGDDPTHAMAAPAGPARTTAARGTATRRPAIYSRAQWGAAESLRDGFSGYGEITGSFVHHTVNANDYSAAEVPSILRAIYAYHVQGRGWSDIGYNFLVDRFGRVWEGRWGGVGRPVIGAHTLGYNEEAFAVSAIGNFESTRPSQAMLAAYARVLAWKLSLHGVEPDARVRIDGDAFAAVNGHRDAASTACPGRYLYARLATIRAAAAGIQHAWSPRSLRRSVTGDPRPDLLVRDGERMRLLAGDAGAGFRAAAGRRSGLGGSDLVTGLGDLTGDGAGDLLVRAADTGASSVLPGTGSGGLGEPVPVGRGFSGATDVTGVPDLTGDGLPDAVMRDAAGTLTLAAGRAAPGFARAVPLSESYPRARAVAGAGDASGDGAGDLWVLTSAGRLVLAAGDGAGGLAPGRVVVARWGTSTLLAAGHDMTGDGRPDVLLRAERAGRVWVRPGTRGGDLGARVGGWSGWDGFDAITMLGDDTGDGIADAAVLGPKGAVSVLPGRGGAGVHPVGRVPGLWAAYSELRIVGDWDGDGRRDLMGRRLDRLWLFPGLGAGRFGPRQGGWAGWGGRRMLTPVGDWDGDGRPDLVARVPGGAVWLFPGRGARGAPAGYPIRSSVGDADRMFGVGRWDRDGAPDLMTRTRDGDLWLWPGNGPGGLLDPHRVAAGTNRFDLLLGMGDLDRDGHPDLVGRDRSGGQLHLLPWSAGRLGSRVAIGSGSLAGDELG
jgi:hypothetical protein